MFNQTFLRLLLLAGLLLLGCRAEPATETANPTIAVSTPSSSDTPTATQTPFALPGVSDDLPLAARVNGTGISLDEYQAELARYQAELAGPLTYTDQDVLNELINQVLLAQAALEAGYQIDAGLIEARLAQLGLSQVELEAWIAANGYTPQSFQQAIERAILAAWMRDQIIAAVPSTADQIHARQILLYNSDEANAAYAQLEAGTDFVTLVKQFDPITLGDLGWFPPGYLLVPGLDEVIFDLEPGTYSPVIQTELGFHIIQVIEKESQRPLAPDAWQALQIQAVQNWLSNRYSQSDIEISVP